MDPTVLGVCVCVCSLLYETNDRDAMVTLALGLEPRALGVQGQCLALSHVPSRTLA